MLGGTKSTNIAGLATPRCLCDKLSGRNLVNTLGTVLLGRCLGISCLMWQHRLSLRIHFCFQRQALGPAAALSCGTCSLLIVTDNSLSNNPCPLSCPSAADVAVDVDLLRNSARLGSGYFGYAYCFVRNSICGSTRPSLCHLRNSGVLSCCRRHQGSCVICPII